MGLLDDAIREHLELKRQRGADPGEVERQEREALGAPRQAEFAAPAEEAEEPVAEAAEPVDAGEEREPFDVEAIEPADEVPPPEEAEVPGPGQEAAAPGYDEDPWLEEERDEVPAGETLERPREDEPGEDVLEDTPDFLQETPEHDRLWFEQRPPRDFDWDK
jgi:hypothetical protein